MYLHDKIILGTAQTDLNYGFSKNKNLSSLISIIKEKKFTLDTAPTYKNIESFFGAFQKTKIKIISKLPVIECKIEIFEKNLIEQIRLICGVVEDGGDLADVFRAEEKRRIVKGVLREVGEGLGRDFEDFLAFEIGGAHAFLSEETVNGVVGAEG